ncbi:MAG: ferrous iron transport protein B [Dysgonamonadaceae bacterium]|nr:ferrous iron transport protein B [Dysgonamonadaceae bacterium]MDD3356596.1 ferrous iron transport protein B [Dysgonamonadaceae bacterium]MDD4247048.1 ferrous iron transport protein B [Dysgonamonadaceae bacterium]
MRLSELHTGEKAYIIKVNGSGAFRKRLLEMGFVRGQEIKSILNAPLKDPIKYNIMEYEVSLRRSEAVMIEISMVKQDIPPHERPIPENDRVEDIAERQKRATASPSDQQKDSKKISVALVGNPNSGKTSIFNIASSSHEHVGNYGGVTVDSKEGKLKHNGYNFKMVDLPGTYSLSAYTPEELFVRKYILEEKPDIIINVISASSLERHMYLTTELMELNTPMVIALNMYDELQESGREFNYELLSEMIDIPIIPTIGKKGFGIPAMLDKIIEMYESDSHKENSNVHISYGRVLEKSIYRLEQQLAKNDISDMNMPMRYICIKLLENDNDIRSIVSSLPNHEQIFAQTKRERNYIENLLREDPESAFTNARYGFVAGGLRETLAEKTSSSETTRILDTIVTNKYVGFPLFFLFMWIMFETTFRLGNYPMEWIEWSVQLIGNFIRVNMPDGPLKDLLVDGIIGGVGGVIVFLPNIVILYAFISFMEDSGYMARAAFIMDKVMHKIGLHGKSFIPLVMGFGCNVPAILATRTIESRSSRMITMLINPLMSCSARLPIYILFVGAFFQKYASVALFGIYIFGILLAVILSLLFRKTLFKEENTPFVMELPPYRMPTVKSTLTHMWDKSRQYLQKMGGIILIASIVIWFLGYFPRNKTNEAQFNEQIEHTTNLHSQGKITTEAKQNIVTGIENMRTISHQENSYIGKIGHFIEPVMRPLGFDWKISVSLISGMAAKEIVVSTFGVLYPGDSESQESLQHRLKQETHPDGSPIFTPLVVMGLMLFVLIYFPCIATIVAIKEESGSWKWGVFTILYTTFLAWFVALLTHQIGSLF